MPATSRWLPNESRRLLFVLALAVTLCALVAPVAVSAEQTYTVSYVGVDYEAEAVQDTAYFWSSLRADEQSVLTRARRDSAVTRSERPRYLDGDEDVRFSAIRGERVYQYRLVRTTDPWWLEYRVEALAVGLVVATGTAGVGVIRRFDTLWD